MGYGVREHAADLATQLLRTHTVHRHVHACPPYQAHTMRRLQRLRLLAEPVPIRARLLHAE